MNEMLQTLISTMTRNLGGITNAQIDSEAKNNRSAVLSFIIPSKRILNDIWGKDLTLIFRFLFRFSNELKNIILPIKTEFTFDENHETVLFTLQLQIRKDVQLY